jgi:hypothetical protein
MPSGDTDVPDDAFTDADCDGIDGAWDAAVFVAPSGSDDASGSRDAPVKTLTKAVELATGSDKAVYVCLGTYVETLALTAGVAIHGGYDCENGWARTQQLPLVAPESGTPLTIVNVTEPVIVDRLALRAPDAVDPGASSIGALVATSPDVVLTHVDITAGNGAAGIPGEPVTADDGASGTGEPGESLSIRNCDNTVTSTPRPLDCMRVAAGGPEPMFPTQCSTGGFVRGGRGGNGANVCTCTRSGGCPAFECDASVVETPADPTRT